MRSAFGKSFPPSMYSVTVKVAMAAMMAWHWATSVVFDVDHYDAFPFVGGGISRSWLGRPSACLSAIEAAASIRIAFSFHGGRGHRPGDFVLLPLAKKGASGADGAD